VSGPAPRDIPEGDAPIDRCPRTFVPTDDVIVTFAGVPTLDGDRLRADLDAAFDRSDRDR
jgi:hypothetical protein